MQRLLPLLALAGALATGPSGCTQATPEPAGPFSLLLITVDTLRADHLSLNDFELATTPALDALFREGFYFDQALSPIARTSPALASLMTGAYPHATGLRSLPNTLREDVFPLAQALRQSGYQTAAVLTNGILSRKRGLDRGFETYDLPLSVQPAAETSARALAAIAGFDPTRPSFTWVHYLDPHTPYHPSKASAQAFSPGYSGRFAERFGFEPEAGRPMRERSPFPEELDLQQAVFENTLPAALNAQIAKLYAAEVHDIDAPIAAFIQEALKTLGNRTIVVFTADHGEALGEHGYFYDHGDFTSNAELHVPLAFLLPETHPLHGARKISGWVSLVDVFPTLLELLSLRAEGPLGDQIEGRSLVPALRGELFAPRAVFAESGRVHDQNDSRGRAEMGVAGRQRAVFIDRWKLEWSPTQPEERRRALFDLARDPGALSDVFRKGHTALPTLEKQLGTWLEAGKRRSAARPKDDASPIESEDLEALRQLGYIE